MHRWRSARPGAVLAPALLLALTAVSRPSAARIPGPGNEAPPSVAPPTAAPARLGRIAGQARDRATQQPLGYASVEIAVLQRGVLVSRGGGFEIEDLPPGIYTLRASRIGYAPAEIPDVLVRPDKTTQVVVELEKRDLRAPTVVVRADPYADRASTPASKQGLSYEEVRRAPGSAGDIARTVQALPGVAHASDQTSDLIVRGGSPQENLTLLDDVPIPNANHFPEYGGAGGSISMLNVQLVRGVSFYTGGFPVQHGDKLSSVLEVKLRDGNRSETSGELGLSMAGAGLVLEGPFAGGRGSYLLNGRRSYLDLVAQRVGTTSIPTYHDLQGKITWQPGARNTLTLLGVAGFDAAHIDDPEDAYSQGFDSIDARSSQYAAGVSWKRLLGTRGHVLVTLHRSENNYRFDVRNRPRRGAEPDSAYFSNSWEVETGLRARTMLRLRPSLDLTVGGELRRIDFAHHITIFADTAQEAYRTARPDSVRLVIWPTNAVRAAARAVKMAAFVAAEQRLSPRWNASLGVRFDRFDYGGQEGWSPRAGLSYRLGESWTCRAAAGLFHQTPAYVALTRTPGARRLPMLRATHWLLGVDKRLGAATLATVEAYVKRYDRLPVDVRRDSYERVPDGTGHVHGLELFVQQRLLARWYGLVSYSYSRSERTDRVYGAYPDDWDYRHVLTLLAGVRPRAGLELSARWRWFGGRPFTTAGSRFEATPAGLVQAGTGYFVGFEGPHNGGRLPAYHRFDLRVDQRRQIGRFHLVAYLDVENVYDRDNVLQQRYTHERAAPEEIFQWQLLPVGGLSLEF